MEFHRHPYDFNTLMLPFEMTHKSDVCQESRVFQFESCFKMLCGPVCRPWSPPVNFLGFTLTNWCYTPLPFAYARNNNNNNNNNNHSHSHSHSHNHNHNHHHNDVTRTLHHPA